MPLTPDDHDLLQRAEADVRRCREYAAAAIAAIDQAVADLDTLGVSDPFVAQHLAAALVSLNHILYGARAATPPRAHRRQERRHDAERRR